MMTLLPKRLLDRLVEPVPPSPPSTPPVPPTPVVLNRSDLEQRTMQCDVLLQEVNAPGYDFWSQTDVRFEIHSSEGDKTGGSGPEDQDKPVLSHRALWQLKESSSITFKASQLPNSRSFQLTPIFSSAVLGCRRQVPRLHRSATVSVAAATGGLQAVQLQRGATATVKVRCAAANGVLHEGIDCWSKCDYGTNCRPNVDGMCYTEWCGDGRCCRQGDQQQPECRDWGCKDYHCCARNRIDP